MNRITGQTRVLGLIGNPVSHTLSPFIHNHLAAAMNINTVYVPFFVEPEHLQSAIEGAKALHLQGLNVTVPYKLDVMSYLDRLDERAGKIDAVNTIKFKDGLTWGYNTDADGLLRSIERLGLFLEGRSVCILGAGGAARSVAVMCGEQKVKKLILVNRTKKKAFDLAEDMARLFDMDIDVCGFEDLVEMKAVDTCFQTTSIGLHPDHEASPIEAEAFFKGLQWAVDLIYNPSETKFLQIAAAHGVRTVNGLGMLFYQAVRAYEIWNEITIPEEVAESVLASLTAHVYIKKG